MMDPIEERRLPVTPQLAFRVALAGGLMVAIFAIIFFRLWFLQVLSGDQFLATANDNRIRDVRIGPDGYVYLLTDEEDAELWRLVPK